MKRILIVSGPNLNNLGKRSKEHYGTITYKELNKLIKDSYPNIKFKFFQSNYEGKIIDYLQKKAKYDALVINPGGLTHTSVSLRDCIEQINKPKIAVHLSNINEREDFRKVDLIKDVVDNVFMGKKAESYTEGINYLLDKYLTNIV